MSYRAPGASPPSTGRSDLLVGLLLGLILSVLAIGVGMWAFMGGGMMGPGMTGGPTSGAGSLAFVASVILLVGAVLVIGRAFGRRALDSAAAPPLPAAPVATETAPPQVSPTQAHRSRGASFDPSAANEVDALTLPLLDRDERLLYIEIKESGRSALQKDLGHRDGFSRSKVTRTLDRLEAKGLIARERDGMTNRVRLTPRGGGSA
jgi:uncharacterized membrane protein